MNEAFDQSVGTQRADMGMFKKFAMNLTTVALPNLISHDLVIVYPMSSMSGYITYIEYQYASNKGATKQGDLISNPFGFGDVDPDFTGGRVVETVKVGDDGTATLAWAPVFVTTDERTLSANAAVVGVEGATVEVVDADKGTIKITGVDAGAEVRVRYVYNNIVVPQNDLPMIKAEMKSIALVAKARRIAVEMCAA